jgi:hypothetical protein
MRGDEGGHVGQHLLGGASPAALGGLVNGAAPAALVEAVDGDAAFCEAREEVGVAVDVVAKAVDEEQFGFDRAIRLSVTVSILEVRLCEK